jgi:integrase
MTLERTTTAGIYKRHARSCAKAGKAAGAKAKCTCGSSSYLAKVSTGTSGRTVSRTFHNLDEAKRWRREQAREVEAGADYTTQETVGQALDTFAAGLDEGASIAKGRRAYKGSSARSYRLSVDRLQVALGGRLAATQLRELTPALVQEVVDELVGTVALAPSGQAKVDAKGKVKRLSASTVRNTIMPLRKVAKDAMRRRVLRFDPFVGVELPESDEVSREAVEAVDAVNLLAALSGPVRAYWAVAFYAGLRAGEISALRWGDIRQPQIRVDESYCNVDHAMTTPKSRAGMRVAPAAAQLFPILNAYRASCANTGDDDLVFPATGATWRGEPVKGEAVSGTSMRSRARKAWSAAGLTATPDLHAARHTYASLMAAEGVSLHELSGFMGHLSIETTAKRYAHLYDEQHFRAAEKLSAAIDRADTGSRIAQLAK